MASEENGSVSVGSL